MINLNMKFTADVSIPAINAIKRKILEKIKRKLPQILETGLIRLNAIPEIDNFKQFLRSPQFAADFGVPTDVQKEMADDVANIFEGAYSDYRISKDEIIFSAINEEALREATMTLWDNSQNNRYILVNAWDVYEYGIIGKNDTGGRIYNFYKKENLTNKERKISRSKMALMAEKKGRRFTFGTGAAPRINSVRSAIANNKDKIAAQFGRAMVVR